MLEDMMDEIEFAASFAPQGPPTVNDIFARRLAPDWEEIEAARREREAADAEAERRENMALANRQMGDPLGNATRAQMATAEARDRVRALEDQLAEAQQVLQRCATEYVDWQEQAEVVTATATRSAVHDLLAPGKQALAEERVERMLAEHSAQAARAPRAVRSRRPFAGEANRSEYCVFCTQDGVSDHDSYLLHSDPEFDCPVTSPEQAAAAERREGGYGLAVR